ncbi:MAG TPA: hypothetical protein VMV72_10290 [Verrucomicrobiae bacterium]|nr:hypothetical protein [Verrucomicrobiae bacterium]
MKVVRIAVLLFGSVVAASRAAETNKLPTMVTVDGIIYSNVTWRTVTPATVTIFHQTGVASIPLEKLSPELQQRFGYDPQKAAAYRAEEAAAAERRLADAQARERLRQQREAEAQESARQEQEAQEQKARDEQSREAFAAIQKANASVEVIPVVKVVSAISLLDTGNYLAQVALSNQTIICAHFDESGKRYLEEATRKYADWQAQQNSVGQQLQIAAQPGTIVLYGGRGAVRIPGGGYGLTYATGSSPAGPASSPPVAAVYAVREENSSCYSLKGSREAGQAEGIKLYVWQ